MPLVSVIINCFNSEKFLRKAIDSVYLQDFDDWEIIFWDNASTDGSAVIANSYDNKIKYYLSKKTIPLGEARNKALKLAKGKYIAFLDCDDEFLQGKLKKQVFEMESNNFALSYSGATIIDEFDKKIRTIKVKNKSGYIFGSLLRHYEIIMASAMVKRLVLTEGNLEFEESLKYCPDYNLFMKIASNYPVGVINKILVNYRKMSNSLSSQSVNIASYENRFTLDYIFSNKPELKTKYFKEASMAYDKLIYYDSVAFLTMKKKSLARENMYKIKYKRWEYFVLYLLLFLPISYRTTLKILKR